MWLSSKKKICCIRWWSLVTILTLFHNFFAFYFPIMSQVAHSSLPILLWTFHLLKKQEKNRWKSKEKGVKRISFSVTISIKLALCCFLQMNKSKNKKSLLQLLMHSNWNFDQPMRLENKCLKPCEETPLNENRSSHGVKISYIFLFL